MATTAAENQLGTKLGLQRRLLATSHHVTGPPSGKQQNGYPAGVLAVHAITASHGTVITTPAGQKLPSGAVKIDVLNTIHGCVEGVTPDGTKVPVADHNLQPTALSNIQFKIGGNNSPSSVSLVYTNADGSRMVNAAGLSKEHVDANPVLYNVKHAGSVKPDHIPVIGVSDLATGLVTIPHVHVQPIFSPDTHLVARYAGCDEQRAMLDAPIKADHTGKDQSGKAVNFATLNSRTHPIAGILLADNAANHPDVTIRGHDSNGVELLSVPLSTVKTMKEKLQAACAASKEHTDEMRLAFVVNPITPVHQSIEQTAGANRGTVTHVLTHIPTTTARFTAEFGAGSGSRRLADACAPAAKPGDKSMIRRDRVLFTGEGGLPVTLQATDAVSSSTFENETQDHEGLSVRGRAQADAAGFVPGPINPFDAPLEVDPAEPDEV